MISFPFDSSIESYTPEGYPVYDRAVDSKQLSSLINKYFTNGIFPNPSTNFQVVASTGLNITVLPGSALINGVTCTESNNTSFVLDQGETTLKRIDTIVLKLDNNTDVRSIALELKKGTPSASPVAPTLTRNESIYELGLANILLNPNVTAITNANITDTRQVSNRCGIIVGAIQQLDTTTLYDQYQTALNEYLDLVARAIGETEAGYLQGQIDTIQGHIDTLVPDVTTLKSEIYPITRGGTGANDYKTALTNLHAPETNTSNLEFYVDPIYGNDSYPGTSSKKFKTITKALSVIPKLISSEVKIYLSQGDYNENVVISDFYGSRYLKIIGSTSASEDTELAQSVNYVVNSFVVNNCKTPVVISGIKILGNTGKGVECQNSFLYLLTCSSSQAGRAYDWATCGNSGTVIARKCNASFRGTNSAAFACNYFGGRMFIYACSGSQNNYGYSSSRGGYIAIAEASTLTANTLYLRDTGSIIVKNDSTLV